VHRRPQAPASPAARYGPLAPARRADPLRVDGSRLDRHAPVPVHRHLVGRARDRARPRRLHDRDARAAQPAQGHRVGRAEHGRGCRRGRRRRAFRPARRRIRTGCRTERQRRRSRPTAEEGGLRMSAPAHNPILVTALRWGAIFAAALAIVAGGVGLLVGGTPGLWGGLLGSVLAFAFLALTAGSMLLGRRLATDDPNSPLFYGVVLA